MPDNPHPHPQEFDQTVQNFLILLAYLAKERMLSFTDRSTVSLTSEVSDRHYNNRYFAIQPRVDT